MILKKRPFLPFGHKTGAVYHFHQSGGSDNAAAGAKMRAITQSSQSQRGQSRL